MATTILVISSTPVCGTLPKLEPPPVPPVAIAPVPEPVLSGISRFPIKPPSSILFDSSLSAGTVGVGVAVGSGDNVGVFVVVGACVGIGVDVGAGVGVGEAVPTLPEPLELPPVPPVLLIIFILVETVSVSVITAPLAFAGEPSGVFVNPKDILLAPAVALDFTYSCST